MERDKTLNIIPTFTPTERIEELGDRIVKLHPRLKEYKILNKKPIRYYHRCYNPIPGIDSRFILNRGCSNLTKKGYDLERGNDIFLYIVNQPLMGRGVDCNPSREVEGEVYDISIQLGVITLKDNLFTRLVNIGVHEIGHMFGAKHHKKGRCYMKFGASLESADLSFCKNCLERIAHHI